MTRLRIHDHLHALEYYHVLGNGHREHVYTEVVDDQGFVLVHDPAKRQEWLTRYTDTCAREYFSRVRAKHGTWFVHVYQLIADERRHVISVRIRWRGESPQATAAG